jgi:flagellar basal-body rod modification protein FlgD
MATSSTPVTSASSVANVAGSTATTNSLTSLTTQDFTNMLVAELQNQDPTQPITNSELMQEVGQIQTIQSTQQLTTTLQSVLLGQNVATAGNLIGRSVQGQDANGNPVAGTVSSVSIANGAATLNVGTSSMPLSNVTQITSPGSGQ